LGFWVHNQDYAPGWSPAKDYFEHPKVCQKITIPTKESLWGEERVLGRETQRQGRRCLDPDQIRSNLIQPINGGSIRYQAKG
jgi:hypothetical protein